MNIYQEIVDTWLSGIARRLRRRLLMPAMYRENLQYDGVHQPVFSEYWVPLPDGSANAVQLELGQPFDFFEVASEVARRIEERRPSMRDRIEITASTGFLRMWDPWASSDLAYRWVLDDLRAIGFTKHLALPDRG